MISTWVRRVWDEVRKQNSLLPPTAFLLQELQDHLCDRFHIITSVKILSSILAGWPQLEKYKTWLFLFCQEALKGLEGLRKEIREKHEAENWDNHEVEGVCSVKIQIRPPVVPAKSKTGRDKSGGDDSEDEAPPRKRRCRERRAVHNME